MSEPEAKPPLWTRLRSLVSRQRLVELSVVVFGVVIALSLENVVQEMRFRGDAHDLETAFILDLQATAYSSMERQAVAPCLVQRLHYLADLVSNARGAQKAVPPLTSIQGIIFAAPQIYRTPSRLWSVASFERALGSEAFKRIPAARANEYGQMFAQIENQRVINDAEYLATAQLAPLAYDQSVPDAQVRAGLLTQIATLDRYQALLTLDSEQIISSIHRLPGIDEKVRVEFADPRDLEAVQKRLTDMYGICVNASAMTQFTGPSVVARHD